MQPQGSSPHYYSSVSSKVPLQGLTEIERQLAASTAWTRLGVAGELRGATDTKVKHETSGYLGGISGVLYYLGWSGFKKTDQCRDSIESTYKLETKNGVCRRNLA